MELNPDRDINLIGMSIAELLVQLNWAKSKRDARQFIQDGAVVIGDFKVSDPLARVFLDENDTWKVLERTNVTF